MRIVVTSDESIGEPNHTFIYYLLVTCHYLLVTCYYLLNVECHDIVNGKMCQHIVNKVL